MILKALPIVAIGHTSALFVERPDRPATISKRYGYETQPIERLSKPSSFRSEALGRAGSTDKSLEFVLLGALWDPQDMQQWIDRLPGGYADRGPPPGLSLDQVRKGIRVEMEHTNDPRIALEIAMDHLWEDRRYYDKLERMERGACGSSYIPENDKLVRCLKRLQRIPRPHPVPPRTTELLLNELDRCMSTNGLGLSPSTVGALTTVGVLVAILVAMPIVGSLTRSKS